ncbi:unnamed protein product [Schistosoma mattheei]|uniref:Uncharacterized protein n=1 Tax=Schistosoma mattheei TaxID=31246 RepID=A0A183NQI0_9TREM|nr:unnamed protein product [Schistosoma mattheei]
MRCSHDSCVSNKIIYKYVGDISSAPNTDQNSNVILSNVACLDDSFISHEILIKCEEQVLNVLKPDNSPDVVALDVICSHNGFISSDIPGECDKYVPNGMNCSRISDVNVSGVGCSHNQCINNRIPNQWYDESEEIASFPEAVREPIYPKMKFAQAENSNPVQDYCNEYKVEAYFPFDCFAGESNLDESHFLITRINAYLSDIWNNGLVYSNAKDKRNMYHNFHASYIMECLE